GAAAKDRLPTLCRRPELAGLLLALFFFFLAREAFFTVYGIYLTELGGSTTLYGASISIATLLGIGLYDAAARLVRRWGDVRLVRVTGDRKSTRLNSSHVNILYAVFCLIKKIACSLAIAGSLLGHAYK